MALAAIALAAVSLFIGAAGRLLPAQRRPTTSASRAERLAERWRLWSRAARVTLLFARLALRYSLCSLRLRRITSPSDREKLWRSTNEIASRILAPELVYLGGIWLKFGQYVASRSSPSVPKEINTACQRMVPIYPAQPISDVTATLLRELSHEDLISIRAVEEAPMAVASVGQLHRAWTRTGRRVVLKVQPPHLQATTKMDLKLARFLAKLFGRIRDKFNFTAFVNEACDEHAKEVDLTIEAANLREIRSNLQRASVSLLTPDVLAAAPRVLVLSYCEGKSLEMVEPPKKDEKDKEKDAKDEVWRDAYISRLLEAWALQIFVDGLFHAEPLPCNLLVTEMNASGGSGKASNVPTLVDFGMCKRLTTVTRLALCRLIHSILEIDCDGLVDALNTLGFHFDASRVEPVEVVKELAWVSGYNGNSKKSPVGAVPFEYVPACALYPLRCLVLLRRLGIHLNCVKWDLVEPMATCASQALLTHARRQLQQLAEEAGSASEAAAILGDAPPPRPPPTSGLQERVMRLMVALSDTGELLGCQACLVVNGKVLVDAAAGRMGPVNPRPVRTDTLFQLYGAGSALLSTIALREVARGALRLDAPVAAAWHDFGAGGKADLTLAQLLNHQTGLSVTGLPPSARLSQLADLDSMLKVVAGAEASAEEAAEAKGGSASHEGLPWGWSLAGAVQESSGMGLEQLLDKRIRTPLGLEGELAFRVQPDEQEGRCATISAVALMKEAGMDLGEMLSGGGGGDSGAGAAEASSTTGSSASNGNGEGGNGEAEAPMSPLKKMVSSGKTVGTPAPAAAGAEATSPGGTTASAGASAIEWERFEGVGQLVSPATLNMVRLRASLLPGVSAHASAHGLAQFYNALGSGRLIPPALLAQAQQLSCAGLGPAGEPVRYGLGFQLGTCAEVGPLQRVTHNVALVNNAVGLVNDAVTAVRARVGEEAGSSAKVRVIGHAGVGGTVGLCVPDKRVAVAVTVSRLSGERKATKRLLECLLAEVGLAAPVGL